MTTISLFTPINYARAKSCPEKALSTISNYFYLGGARATVVKGSEVQFKKGKVSWQTIALKVTSYILLFPLTLTLLTINIILRSKYHFTVITPPSSNKKPVSDIPQIDPKITLPSTTTIDQTKVNILHFSSQESDLEPSNELGVLESFNP